MEGEEKLPKPSEWGDFTPQLTAPWRNFFMVKKFHQETIMRSPMEGLLKFPRGLPMEGRPRDNPTLAKAIHRLRDSATPNPSPEPVEL